MSLFIEERTLLDEGSSTVIVVIIFSCRLHTTVENNPINFIDPRGKSKDGDFLGRSVERINDAQKNINKHKGDILDDIKEIKSCVMEIANDAFDTIGDILGSGN